MFCTRMTRMQISCFFEVEVRATGWVGFSFATPNNMQNYDVVVDGKHCTGGYLRVSPLR